LTANEKSLTRSGASPQHVINVRDSICFAKASTTLWLSALVAGWPVGELLIAR